MLSPGHCAVMRNLKEYESSKVSLDFPGHFGGTVQNYVSLLSI